MHARDSQPRGQEDEAEKRKGKEREKGKKVGEKGEKEERFP